MNQLDPRVVTLWRLQGLVAVFTSWLPMYALLGWGVGGKFGFVAAAAAIGGFAVLLALRALIWPAFQYGAFRYAVRETDLLVEQGVIYRQTICVPRDRIQHVDTRQGWLERLFDLSRLLVYTGAGLSADGSLPGLDSEEAVRLRDELALGGRGGDDGV